MLRFVSVAAAATASTTVTSCADDGPLPAVTATALASVPPAAAGLEGVPVLEDATLLQSPAGTDGAVTVSYRVDGELSQRDVLMFYDDVLAKRGWIVADPVVETSDGIWRGDWIRAGQRLQIVANPMRVDGSERDGQTQFNLVLLPDSADITVASPAPRGWRLATDSG